MSNIYFPGVTTKISAPVKAWALMWHGVDESSCYGIVTRKELADEWESRGDENTAAEFTLNEMPSIERWRDEKMFPYAPRTGPATTIPEQMVDYFNHVMLETLLT